MHLGQRPLPVESYKSPSIDAPRFVNSRKRRAGSKSEIQQIRSQINLGADIATVNDGKHTESTDGNLPCNVTLQSNVATYDRADTERIEPKLPASINATIFARNGHLHVFEKSISSSDSSKRREHFDRRQSLQMWDDARRNFVSRSRIESCEDIINAYHISICRRIIPPETNTNTLRSRLCIRRHNFVER